MSEENYLVCAPADSPSTIPGSIFTHVCAKCKRRVMLAPSGQAHLKIHPDTVTICFHCIPRKANHQGFTTAAPAETLAAEILSATPNLYRNRN